MKADLHVHSCYSKDGKSTPEQIVEAALEKGLGCVATTDHNEYKAHLDLEGETRIIVFPGEEVSSVDGHIIALGIDRHIQRGMSIKDTIEAIHEAGGIAIAAHPYRWWSGIGEKNVIPDFDGVEARNGRSVKKDNVRSEKLARDFGPVMTAGSDAHVPRFVGAGYVEVSDDCRTWQDVVNEIREGRVISVDSESRKPLDTLKYGFKSITEWILRGFKRM